MILLTLALSLFLVNPLLGQQKRVNLDDIKIQGEGMRGAQISLGKGERTDLEKHLTIRKNFREDILQELPSELLLKLKSYKKTKENQ